MLMYGKPCLIPIVKTAKNELIKPNIVCTMIKYGGKKRGVGEGGGAQRRPHMHLQYRFRDFPKCLASRCAWHLRDSHGGKRVIHYPPPE